MMVIVNADIFVCVFSQLCTVRGLLQKTMPILQKLKEKAADALRERDKYISERDRAVEGREQVRLLLHFAAANHDD